MFLLWDTSNLIIVLQIGVPLISCLLGWYIDWLGVWLGWYICYNVSQLFYDVLIKNRNPELNIIVNVRLIWLSSIFNVKARFKDPFVISFFI